MTISPATPYGIIPVEPSPGFYTRLANAVAFLNSRQLAIRGTEYVLDLDKTTQLPVVQVVDMFTREVLQRVPNASIFALVNQVS